ncbi:AAA family ATPase [Sulfurimonas sp.]|jgi:transitional endoplasmic reticulum ATPase|uniref:AAA family ATPase n=1 Tax=Sulfurimonas sp. TaxID=2022749 RepID=UPI0025FBE8CF|nr:AAA family ATPase [Sulfurimonas sp.]MBT5934895.1 AAA family ATPase [Sulfurimonas sp.]
MRRKRNRTVNTVIEFDKTQVIDKRLIDKASLWSLRIILNLSGHREFIDKDNGVSKDTLLAFLDGNQFLDTDEDKFSREEVLNFFKESLLKLEDQKKFTTNKILAKNIAQISSLMKLNQYEEQILEFVTFLKQYELLDDAVSLLGNELNTTQTKRALSVILNIKKKHIDSAFASNSKLSKSSLVTIDKSNTHSLDRKLDSISDTFLDNLLNLDEDISVMIKDSVKVCNTSSLKLKDYQHISSDINILVPYLESAVKSKQTGVNILLYGRPGTGKTELAKVLAKKLKTKLFEVSYTDEDDEPIEGTKRLKAYKSAQVLLSNKRTLLMYDEAEDIFESGGSFFGPPVRQKDKAWINRVLETNTLPTIWITNNIDSIDNALVRRFDMSIEIPIPVKSKREEIIKNYSNNLLNEKSIKSLAKNENIAPALISTTAKVISAIDTKDSDKAFTHLLSNTLKAQGYGEIKKENSEDSLPSIYNPSYVNTTTDLDELTKGIKKTKSARLCLYGVPGTGKSAFGKYLADMLDKPLLLKKGSDLISKWVGGTEQNIANAFKEASDENAVLVFDEVDSFLADRTQAKQSWEVTQVNEMLVQMENFDGVFIATTNLMDNLDKASLRRFDLKLEFDSLQPEQAWKMFKEFSKELKLPKVDKVFKQEIQSLKQLTPGDFSAVVRQNRFRPIHSVEDFIERLQDEIAVKDISTDKVMGFLVS